MTAIDVPSREARLNEPSGGLPPEARVVLRRVTGEGVSILVGSAVAAIALVWVLYERILPTSGALGFWVCAYLAFVGLYAAAGLLQWNRRVVADKLAMVAAATAALLVMGVLGNIIGYLVYRGVSAVRHSNFFTDTMSHTGPLSPLTSGGAIHAMVGSLEQLALATSIAVPLGLLAALYMAEVGGRTARVVRTLIDAMTALPSIVAGLFILSMVIVTLGAQRSGLAASLAITIMMMPIVTRAAEIVIRLVPNTLREAAYALGASQWRVAFSVVLPTARSSLVTAILLAMARGVGETSPVLLTAGFTKEINTDPTSGPQTNLPVYIWNYVHYPQTAMIARGFGAALTLLAVVLVLFVVARVLGGKAPGEMTRRQRGRASRTRLSYPGVDPPGRVVEGTPA